MTWMRFAHVPFPHFLCYKNSGIKCWFLSFWLYFVQEIDRQVPMMDEIDEKVILYSFIGICQAVVGA